MSRVEAPVRARVRAGFSVVREALTGGDANAASGSLSRAIPMLAVPMVLEMAMEALRYRMLAGQIDRCCHGGR